MGTRDDQLHEAGTQALAGGAAAPPDPDQFILRDLAASFAHELNQPLAAIAAYADGAATLLRRDAGHSPQALNIIQAIAGQALRAGAVVQQLRGTSRALPRATIPLDPNALIRTLQPLLESLATQREVRLLIALQSPAPAVMGNADRLRALLLMLVSSALDTVSQLPPDQRQVTITSDGDGRTVELSAAGPQGMLFQLRFPCVDT